MLLWLRKNGKGKGKGIKEGKSIFDTFIYENKGKYEKKKIKCHRLHVRRKMKKIYSSLIKRLLGISWYLLSFQFLSYLIIISLSHTLGYLEFSWSNSALCQGRGSKKKKDKKGKEARIKQGKLGSSSSNRNACT